MDENNFKVKTKKKKSGSRKQRTLDSIHQEKISEFTELRNSLNEKKKKLTDLSKKYKLLSQKKLAELTDSELDEKLSLQDSIKDLENEISNISSKNLEKKYLLDSGLLIFQYYENMDRIAQGGNFQSEQNHNPGNILNFFS